MTTTPAPTWAEAPPVPAPRRRFGALAAAGRPLGAAIALVVAVLVVVPAWALQRLLRVDPVAATPGWNRRDRRAVRPERTRATGPRRPHTTLRRTAVAAVVVAAVAGLASPDGRRLVEERLLGREEPVARPFSIGLGDDGGASDFDLATLDHPVPPGVEPYVPDPDATPPAHRDDAWWGDQDYQSAQGLLFDPSQAFRQVNPYQLQDVHSPDVNVVDGNRSSWRPPACACRRLTVWLYGGSTAYGLDQRDDHTIASALARLAAADGLILDVSNRGQLGHLHWMEAERFAWDLTGEPAPDLALFYDGVNDAWATNALTGDGAGDIRAVVDPTLRDLWLSSGRSAGGAPEGPPGSRFIGRPTDQIMGPELAAEVTIARYQRSRQLSLATAAAHEVPVRYYWQPSRFSRALVLAEPHGDSYRENNSRWIDQLLRAALPDDVVDVGDALDGNTDPLYTDEVHHNEEGAQLVAEAIYADLEPTLRELDRSGGGG